MKTPIVREVSPHRPRARPRDGAGPVVDRRVCVGPGPVDRVAAYPTWGGRGFVNMVGR